jgi:hypothetical protein
MRYYIKEKIYPEPGLKRIIKRFALFPMSGNFYTNERRWLEIVYLEQHYHIGSYTEGWINDGFVEKCDYLNYKKIKNTF